MARFLILLTFGIFGVSLLQAWHYLPQLPAQMNFNIDLDQQNTVLSLKKEHVVFGYCLLQFFACINGVISYFTSGKHAARIFHILNKTYWLEPEREKQTMLFLKEYSIGCAAFSAIFIAALMEVIFQIYSGPNPVLPTGLLRVVFFMGVFIGLTGVAFLYLRFRKPDNAA